MAMAVAVQLVTGSGPAFNDASAVKWNREDSAAGAVAIPAPTEEGAAFSFVKSFIINISDADGLSMTDLKVGKSEAESSVGTKLWYRADNAEGSYAQATAAPAATEDNNETAPAIPAGGSNDGVAALPLIGAAPVYSAGPHSTTGRKGNLVQVCLGVDARAIEAGNAVPTPSLVWQWAEG